MFDSFKRWLASKDVEERRHSKKRGRQSGKLKPTADNRYQRRLDVVEHSIENVEQRLKALDDHTISLQQEITVLKESLDRMEESINRELKAGLSESKKIGDLVKEIESKRLDIDRLQKRFIKPLTDPSRREPSGVKKGDEREKAVTLKRTPPPTTDLDDAVDWDDEPPRSKVRTLTGRAVTTSFLLNGGKVLILKRSKEVRSYPGRWAGISGSIEKGESPNVSAIREIGEETGLHEEDLTLIRVGAPFKVVDGKKVWEVHPFLFMADTRELVLDWEHDASRWILPNELARLDTVPELKKSLHSVID